MPKQMVESEARRNKAAAAKVNQSMINASLVNFDTVNKRSCPLNPYMDDKDVYKRRETPNTYVGGLGKGGCGWLS